MKYTAILSRFDKGTDSKYIVIQNTSQFEAYIFGGPFDHKTLFEDFQSLVGNSSDYAVFGGGLYQIDDFNKKIFTRGKSGTYGKPDVNLVQKILESEYPDYEVNVTISDYVQE